jgi:orotidine-5'-phosphate decarboxylase
VTELAVALDVGSAPEALRLADVIGDAARWYKVGPVLCMEGGAVIIRELRSRGKNVFLDLKWHDIPNTVARAVAAAGEAGVALATVHLAGGARMLEAAVKAKNGDLRLLGVGVLTSLDAQQYGAVVGRAVADVGEEQRRLVRFGVSAGLDGYVSAAHEARAVRAVAGARAFIVVPGIRRETDATGDQARTATPREAARAGADLLVVGRPVTTAADPRREAVAIAQEAQV